MDAKGTAKHFRLIAGLIVFLLSCATAQDARPRVSSQVQGSTGDGEDVRECLLTNARGTEVRGLTYGAILRSVHVRDRNGKLDNVTLSLDSVDTYLAGHPPFGSTVGRSAIRIGGFELATRLSCFLWSSMPDHELISLAKLYHGERRSIKGIRNELSKDEVNAC